MQEVGRRDIDFNTMDRGTCTCLQVEVRDSARTGYLVPGRDGPGALPNGQSCWDVTAAVVAVTWKLRSTFRPGNYIWSLPMVLDSWPEIFENGGRGFTQTFDAHLVSIVVWPGEPFLKKLLKSINTNCSKYID